MSQGSTRRASEPLRVLTLALLLAPAGARLPAAPAVPGGSQGPELVSPGLLSTGDDEGHVTFAPEGNRLYFIKNAPNFAHWTVLVTERRGQGWSEPVVAPFSGPYSDADLSFSPAGDVVYFVSTRPIAPGGSPRPDTEIWRMPRSAQGAFGEPEHVAELTSEGSEWFPNATTDGWLYFGSERRAENLGTEGTSDLWRARLERGRFGAPENLGPRFSTAGNDIEPWVSSDGRLMIFASNGRPDTRGSYDLYASRNCGSGWSEPRNLGDRVNSPGWDFGGRPDPEGRWLYFTSNRAYTDRPLERTLDYQALIATIRSPGNGLRDIYRVALAGLDLGPACPE